MKVKEALEHGREILSNSSSTNNLDCRLLLAFACNCEVSDLLLNREMKLTKIIADKFFALVNRRKQSEPIAYIIGKKEFYGLNFLVNKQVLIPRPETELLIELAQNIFIKNNQNVPINNYHILELGTGSGALAVTLAKLNKQNHITATDISASALQVAQENIKYHQVTKQITLLQSDWYQSLPKNKYQLIISNPPYISEYEYDEVAAETKLFEPPTALYAKQYGLASYQIIISKAKQFLHTEGFILLEIGYKQASAVVKLLKEHNFTNIQISQDLSKLDRAISAQLKD